MILCSLLAMGVGLANVTDEAGKRRFTLADDIGLSHFGDPYTLNVDPITFSPDGHYFVVVTERGLIDQNRPESTLRVFSTEAVHQFLGYPNAVREPPPVWTLKESTYKEGPVVTHVRWLADSGGFAFLVKNVTGNDQLFLANLNTKTVRVLTSDDQNVTGYDICRPDRFVYTLQSPAVRDKTISEGRTSSIVGTGHSLNSLIFPEDTYSSTSKSHDLSELWAVVNGKRFQVKDKSSGRPFSLYRDGQDALALSPDGRFAVTARAFEVIPPQWETLYPPPTPQSAYQLRAGRQDLASLFGYEYVSEYVLVDLNRGKVKSLTDAPIAGAAGWWSGTRAAWAADGQSVALSNTFLPPGGDVSRSKTNRPCVAVVNVETGRPTCVEQLKETENGNHFIEKVHFISGSGERLIVDVMSRGLLTSISYIRGNEGSWTAQATTNGSTLQSPTINVAVKEGLNSPPVLVATDKASRATRVILDPNPQLKTIELGQASVFKWKDKGGRDWIGALYKPPDYSGAERYPLVIQTSGFLENQFRPGGIYTTAYAAQELVAAGFVVLETRCPISVIPAEEGPCNVGGYEAAVQQLVADGVVDPNRVGIIGFSRTCYHVMKALTTSTLHFKAASITDGVNEGYLQYVTTVDQGSNAIAHEADAMIGAPPFGEGLQQWLKRSPEFNLDKVEAALQVVAIGRSGVLFMWEPYAVLRLLKKPVDLIILNSDEHVLTNPGARIISQGGTVDWFRFWLNSEEDPDPAKADQYARWRELRKLREGN